MSEWRETETSSEFKVEIVSRPKVPFRDLHPAAKVTVVIVLAVLVVVAVALLFLLGRWGYHAYLWLWQRA